MLCSVFLICDLINLKQQQDVIKLFPSLEKAKEECWPIVISIFPNYDDVGYFDQNKHGFDCLIYQLVKPSLLKQFPWLQAADKASLNDTWPLDVKECEDYVQGQLFTQRLTAGENLTEIHFNA